MAARSVQLLALQAVNNHGPAVTLNGLTLRNGKASGAGGAIFNDQGTPHRHQRLLPRQRRRDGRRGDRERRAGRCG